MSVSRLFAGPASVAFGNQAMGGVINLITRDSQSVAGGTALIEGGTYGFGRLTGEYGGDVSDHLAGYIGVSGMTTDDYDGGSGSSKQVNTESKRRGALASLSWNPGPATSGISPCAPTVCMTSGFAAPPGTTTTKATAGTTLST